MEELGEFLNFHKQFKQTNLLSKASLISWRTEIKTLMASQHSSTSSLRLLLLLSHFSRVWLCATPETAAHQAPLSLGFFRQEHWSGLPFPSPMHESEKWKWKVKMKPLSHVRLLATPWTAAYQAPPSMGFSRQEYWSGVPSPSLSLRLQPHKNPYEFYIQKKTDFHFGQLKNRLPPKKRLSFPNSLEMAEVLIIDKIYSLPLHNGNYFCVLDR